LGILGKGVVPWGALVCALALAAPACYRTQEPPAGHDAYADSAAHDTSVVDTFVDAVDVPDTGWPCTPVLAESPRAILGSLSVSVGEDDDPDHPDLATLERGEAWLLAREVEAPGTMDTPRLTLVEVDPATAMPGGSYFHPIWGVELRSVHPLIPFGASMAVAYPDLGDFSMNEILFWLLDYPPAGGVFGAFPDTDFDSSDPAMATNGREVFCVWRQEDEAGFSTIDFAVIDAEGSAMTSGTLSDDDAIERGQPVVAPYGEGYVVAWFAYEAPLGAHVRIDEVDFLGGPGTGSTTIGVHDAELVGRPAVTSNGSSYLMLWEDVGGPSGMDSALHVHGRSVDGSAVPRVVLTEGLAGVVGPVTAEQEGMLDAVWADDRVGVVWVHEDSDTASHVWFFELEIAPPEARIVNGPFLLNPDAGVSFNPAIAWVGTGSMRYYVLAWVEYSRATGTHVLYTSSYGCSM
jgi:hypothetical protein